MQMACAILSTASSLAGCGDGLFEPASARSPDAAAPDDGVPFMIGGQSGTDSSAPPDAMLPPVVASVDFPAKTIVTGSATVTFGEGSYTSPTNVKVEWLSVSDVKVKGPYGRVLRVTFDKAPISKPSVSIDVGSLADGLLGIRAGLVLAKLKTDTVGVDDQWIELQNIKLQEDGFSSRLVGSSYDLVPDNNGKLMVTVGVLLSCSKREACVAEHQMTCDVWCQTERPTFSCGKGSLCQ